MNKNKLLAVLLLGGLTFAGCGKQDANQGQNQAVEENKNVAQAIALEEEPRYNTPIKMGFDGDLCMAGQNLAEIKGYFKDKGIDIEFINTQNGKDALSTGQIDVMTGEFGSLIVPATKGL
ncbi:MAG: ABC transporter substrate-binding protein, partial [Anaerococcus sp.]|nr:ABC transporter substrate-binding protein [Anaerococcus sp.]